MLGCGRLGGGRCEGRKGSDLCAKGLVWRWSPVSVEWEGGRREGEEGEEGGGRREEGGGRGRYICIPVVGATLTYSEYLRKGVYVNISYMELHSHMITF